MDGSHRRRWNNPSPFTGYGVEYSYFIGTTGNIVQTRDESERTGHTMNVEVNDASISVVVAGNFDIETPNRRELVALRKVVLDLQKRYPNAKVIGHRDASGSACPGANLMRYVQKFSLPSEAGRL